MSALRACAALAALHLGIACAAATELPQGEAVVTVDLATGEGAALLGATWRYAPARVVAAEFFAPGADGQPGTTPVPTHDIEPKAGRAGFDDSAWQVLAPDALDDRQGDGRFSLNWYRTKLTIPERIGAHATRGATIVLRVTVDDYAEVWVDGEIPRHASQNGGSVIAGWNAENTVVVARNATPGREIELAIFGANGPLSNPPTNYVWIRSASIELYPGDGSPTAIVPSEVNVEVIRHDPEMDFVIGRNPKAYKLADGFVFTEGPVWLPNDGGQLLFSDPNANAIYRYADNGALSVFRSPSGYSGADIGGVWPAGVERAHARPRAAGSRSTSTVTVASPASSQTGRDLTIAGRIATRGKRLEQPERSGLSLGWLALLHRPAVRAAEVRRRPAQGAARSAACTCCQR